MKNQLELTRSFGGIVSNDIKSFNSKEHRQSETRNLRAYLKGIPYFTNGTLDEKTGELVKFKVEENWSY